MNIYAIISAAARSLGRGKCQPEFPTRISLQQKWKLNFLQMGLWRTQENV